MLLSHGLEQAGQVLALRRLQPRHQGNEAVEAAVDGLRLPGVDAGQHPQQHVVTCNQRQGV